MSAGVLVSIWLVLLITFGLGYYANARIDDLECRVNELEKKP